MNKKINIHFVCEGNTFRSRLAEAYLRSKHVDATVTSSGVKAAKNYNGPITIYSKNIAKNENIEKYLAPSWTQTTKELIEKQDLVIFMNKKYYNFCTNDLHCTIKEYLIWDIPDVFDYPNSDAKDYADKVKIYTENAHKSYQKIKKNIYSLIIKEAL
ncbi:MAG: hypothetical protein HGB12_10755 [Bacteroidetes bacterium]|nr:hypothetical protein [Bacteroidota bacterium]